MFSEFNEVQLLQEEGQQQQRVEEGNEESKTNKQTNRKLDEKCKSKSFYFRESLFSELIYDFNTKANVN